MIDVRLLLRETPCSLQIYWNIKSCWYTKHYLKYVACKKLFFFFIKVLPTDSEQMTATLLIEHFAFNQYVFLALLVDFVKKTRMYKKAPEGFISRKKSPCCFRVCLFFIYFRRKKKQVYSVANGTTFFFVGKSEAIIMNTPGCTYYVEPPVCQKGSIHSREKHVHFTLVQHSR